MLKEKAVQVVLYRNYTKIMDSVKNFFDSFKEFVWDIIGYLLPGSYLLILLSICINENLFISTKIKLTNEDSNLFIFLLGSYLLGYLVYGLSFLKEKKLGNKSYMKKIEKNISDRKAINWAKEILRTKFKTVNIEEDFSDTSVRDLRNVVMSFIPEADQKIYTFTFRSDVSNNTANISLILGILGTISCLINLVTDFLLFNTGLAYLIFYICLIGAYYLLRETRNRFYAISMSIPFSIFTSKHLDDETRN